MLRHNNRHRTSPLGLGDKQCVDPRYGLLKRVEKRNCGVDTLSVKCSSSEVLHLTDHSDWKSVQQKKQKVFIFVKLLTQF